MELRSLRVKKDGVTVDWVTHEGADGRTIHTHSVEGSDAPHPDLEAALQAFLAPCLTLLELPTTYGHDCRVSSLTISAQKGDRRGLQVNLVKTLERTGRPLNLTTPLLVETDEPAESEALAELHEEFWSLLATVEGEAQAYTTGKHAQGDLFDPTAEGSGQPALVTGDDDHDEEE